MDYTTTVGWVAEACRGRITSGDPGEMIETITTDSRELGENNLFIPLVGETFDGHDFIKPLSENRSVRSYLTMRGGYTKIAARNGVSEIRCDDTLKALGAIAARHRNDMDPEVIGISGTNGKTTTKELTYAILNARWNCLKNARNYNNEIGVPITLLGLNASHEIAVIEMGMNHPGELDRLSRITRPDLALITNVGEGHLEFMGSVENVALAKSEIMNGMNPGAKLLLNREMNCFDTFKRGARTIDLVVKTFGLSDSADIYPDEYRLFRNSISIRYQGEEITVPLYGIHNVYNVIAAIAVAGEYGVDPSAMRDALAGFVNLDGRSQIIDRGYIVIDDSYNSNPMSLMSALRSAGEIFPDRRKIAVLSDMKELGAFAKGYHAACGRAVHANNFSMILVWGDMARHYAEGAAEAGLHKDNIRQFETKEELSRYLQLVIDDNDAILIKGSRAMKMEDVVRAITEREG
ncbi:MAG: hypothetical protein A2176_14125 [Spirochaetes bacterium RBG_13_51_14]|nr:MAG: hypothetical protein A2176_14125 [Spirochaetes bacterium RBG_13_51_14]